MMPWLMLGGAALGAVKSAEDKKAWRAQQLAEAETTRMSPWTGMKGKTTAEPSTMGPMMQGALTGAMIGQGMGEDDPSGAVADDSPMKPAAQEGDMNFVGPTKDNSQKFVGPRKEDGGFWEKTAQSKKKRNYMQSPGAAYQIPEDA